MDLPTSFNRQNLRTAGLIAGIIGVFALVLHFMGRIPLCTCGFGIWTGNAQSSETSQLLMDPYTLSHILHGIIFYLILLFLAYIL